jgi:hypothetical protein
MGKLAQLHGRAAAKGKRILLRPRLLAVEGLTAYLKEHEFLENQRMSNGVNGFLGDSPLRVLIKLLILSVAVGFLMSIFGLYPDDILFAVRDFFLDLWNTGFKTLGRLGDYLLLGAVIVIPVFILIRLFSYRR